MALIKCPDCGCEISTTAETCPRCHGLTLCGKLRRGETQIRVLGLMGCALLLLGLYLFMAMKRFRTK